jgi:uncharacterized protein
MSDSLEQQVNQRMKDSMRAKDKRTVTLMRMIKSQVMEKVTHKSYKGESGDALWLPVIESYVKSAHKNLKEYRSLGDTGQEHADQIQWEISALEQYLPQKADEATTRIWVSEAIASVSARDVSQVGRVMGAVMKSHKGEVNPTLVKSIATELLS